MRRNTLNFLIDAVTLAAMTAMVATGLLIRYVLPPGSRGGGGLSLWGWTRHDWGDLHFWLAISLGGLLAAHLALHWTWACATVQHWCGGRAPVAALWRRAVYGGVFSTLVIAVIGGFLWLAAISVSGGMSGEQRQARGRRSDDGATALRTGGNEDSGASRQVRRRGGSGPG